MMFLRLFIFAWFNERTAQTIGGEMSLCGTFVFFCDVDHNLKVKDGLKILHLRLANANQRKGKYETGCFLALLTRLASGLIERHT